VNVTDNLGCIGSACANVLSPAQLQLTMSSTGVSPTDFDVNGTATANPSGGTSPYTYLWNDNQTTQTATGLAYGIYTVTVTDDNGCTISSSVVVNKPSCINFEASVATTNINCFGNANGTATVTVDNGGSGNYSYAWSSPISSTSSSVTGLSAGSYLVTVTDNTYNCVEVVAFSILEPAQLVNVMNSTNAVTIGGNEGTATANPSGGTAPYTYLWSPGFQTTQGITGLTMGTYVVTVTDDNGCSLIDSVYISQPPCNNLLLTGYTTPVSCFGGSDGTATAFVLAGKEPYTFSWMPGGQTTQSISGLSAGVYTVTVIDSLNCTTFLSLTVTQPSVLSAAAAPTNPQCSNTVDGTIELVVSGGTFPYSYNWSNNIYVEDQFNLTGGTYTVTVTDSKGCSVTTSATLTTPAVLAATANITPVTCFNGNNGVIDLTPQGGVLPYSYDWSNGATSQDLIGIPSGVYTVTLTDGNGCTNQSLLQFFMPQPDDLVADSILVDCHVPGADSALVVVYPSGGSGGSYYVSFDNGITFQTQGDYDAYLPGGSLYYIVIKDSNNCVSSVHDSIYVYPKVEIKGVLFDACFANGQATTPANVVIAGGVGGAYQVSFDNGVTFGPFGNYTANLSPNQTYYVIARDSTGCQSDTIVVNVPDSLDLTFTTSNYNGFNISCFGFNNGEIDVTVTGGTVPYTYAWTSGNTTQDVDSLVAGTYQLVVTDFRGCKDSIQVTLIQPPVLVIDSIIPIIYAGGYNISCNGLSNGSANLYVQGGTPGYTFNWNGGAYTSEDLSGIGAGTYSVTVTDQNSCTVTGSITLNEPPVLAINNMIPSSFNGFNISCFGGSNGTIDLVVAGGTPSYTYNWGSYGTSEDLSGLSAGSYTVTVTDQNNCTVSSSITLTQPPVLDITSAIISSYAGGFNVSCNGSTNGSVNITFSGGVAPHNFNWSNAATTEDITGVGAGTYTLTITDFNSCTVDTTVTLTQPPALVVDSIVSPQFNGGYNISCFGLSDGDINLYVSGGVSSYNYNWNGGIYTTQNLQDVPAGIYLVTVSDQNSCTVSTSITLTQPDELVIDSIVPSIYAGGYNISCYGLVNGSIDLFVDGGTPTYNFNWNNGAYSSQNLDPLTAGTYQVTVTDLNGCTVSGSITLTQPDELLIDSIIPSIYAGGYNISCNGLQDGSINLYVDGGTPNYSYNWNYGSYTSANLTNLVAGVYSVTVTDLNSCTVSGTITLIEPPVLVIDSIVPIVYAGGYNISCFGLTDGNIDLFVSGGSPGYSYVWNNGAYTVEDLTNVPAGFYTVTVTDQNGCTRAGGITLSQPNQLVVTSLTATTYAGNYNISCYGLSDGNIDLEVSGGTLIYNYNWNSGAYSNQDLLNIPAGVYQVTVTDLNNCTVTSSITLIQPQELLIDSIIPSLYAGGYNISCNGLTNGSINLYFSGGTSSFNFNWNNGAFNSQNLTSIGAGTYTVVVTDANSCSVTETIELTQPDPIIHTLTANQFNGGWNISCNGLSDGSIDLEVSGGTPEYSYNWNNSSTNQDLSGLTAGTYIVVVSDQNGCSFTDQIILTQPDAYMLSATVNDVLCNGFGNGSIDLTVTGGQPQYSYSWSNNATTQDLSNLGPGTYTVTIVDQNSCDTTYVFSVIELSPITAAAVETDVDCHGNNNGAINLIVGGGSQPYTFVWSNGADTEDLNNLSAGIYVYTITDINGCTLTDTANVYEPELLTVTLNSQVLFNGHNISFYNGNDGSITTIVNGGTPEFTYLWSTADTTKNLSNLTAGTYSVIVTDANGCTATASITLTQPLELAMPNAYSPNGDGFNDFFVIHGIEAYPNNVFTVVNRWGNVVYEKKNYHNEWNGNNNNGGQLPDGTYFVILDINEGEIILKGYVDMRRSK
jgi:gliding motility-associated-like protein